MPQGNLKLTKLVATSDLDGISNWLTEHGALDIADELIRLPPTDQAVVFRVLAKDRALAVFEALDPVNQQQLIDALADDSVHELFRHIDAGDRARLLDEMPAIVLVALPVLDAENRLVGVLTVDDAMEVIEEEVTEDIHRADHLLPHRPCRFGDLTGAPDLA